MIPRRLERRRTAPALAAAAGLALAVIGPAGCESPIETSDPDLVRADAVARGLDVPPRRTRPGGLLPGLEQGLRTRQWRVVEADLAVPLPELLAAASIEPPPGTGADARMLAHLAGNGLRLVAVPRDSLQDLRASLGTATMDAETWHGESPGWRELASAEIASPGLAVASRGRVRRWDPGQLELRARAWTQQMEDGPHLQVDLNVAHLRVARSRGLLNGAVAPRARTVDELRFELATPADLVWILVPAPATETWPAPGTPVASAGDEALGDGATATADAPGSSRAPRPLIRPFAPGPSADASASSVGPASAVVVTAGELLLTRPLSPGTRDLIVLEPELPDWVFPAGHAGAANDDPDAGATLDADLGLDPGPGPARPAAAARAAAASEGAP